MSYPRDLPEVRWSDATSEELRKLHLVLIGSGCSTAEANGLVGWLIAGAPKDQSKTTLAKYRATLRELTPPVRGRPARNGGRGRKVIAIAAMAASAAVGGGVSAHQSENLAALAGGGPSGGGAPIIHASEPQNGSERLDAEPIDELEERRRRRARRPKAA